MQTKADFINQQPFALLLIGPPLSGKTNVAFQFDSPYFLDADDKLANAVTRFPDKEFYFDCPLRKPDGKAVVAENLWTYTTECIKAAVPDPRVKTVVIDSVSAVSDFLIQHILQFPSTAKVPLQVGGIKVMDQSQWMPFRDLWKRLIMGVRAAGKPLIAVCHEDYDKDEATGTFLHRPLIPGSLKSNFASMFTDVWRCESRISPDPAKPGQMKTTYYVRTQPTARMNLANSLDLPAEWVFNAQEFRQRLDKARGVKPQAQPDAAAVAAA